MVAKHLYYINNDLGGYMHYTFQTKSVLVKNNANQPIPK